MQSYSLKVPTVTDTATYNQQLMHAFDFTAADLASNREGRVSEGQVKRLQRDQRRILAITGGALAFIIVVIAVIFALDRAGEGALSLDDLAAIIVPFGLVTAIALYVLQRQQLDTVNKLIYSDVRALKGEITLNPRNKRVADHLTIGKTHFTLTPAQIKLMHDHHERVGGKLRYHIYRVNRVSRILSIEVVN